MRKISGLDYRSIRTDSRLDKIRLTLGKRQPGLTVVLENINDRHNLSAVLRSCDAVGAMEVCMVYYGTQPVPVIAESSSASARKWMDTPLFDSISDCFSYLRRSGKMIFTTQISKKSVSLYDLDLTQPLALVFGNEHSGVSEEAALLADGNFIIPQVGMIQSLNISVAAAVSLYEAFRQRTLAGMYDNPQLGSAALEEAVKDWAGR